MGGWGGSGLAPGSPRLLPLHQRTRQRQTVDRAPQRGKVLAHRGRPCGIDSQLTRRQCCQGIQRGAGELVAQHGQRAVASVLHQHLDAPVCGRYGPCHLAQAQREQLKGVGTIRVKRRIAGGEFVELQVGKAVVGQRGVGFDDLADASGAHVAAQVFGGFLGGGLGAGAQDEFARRLIGRQRIERQHGVAGGAAAGEKIQHGVAGVAGLGEEALDEGQGFGVREIFVADDFS